MRTLTETELRIIVDALNQYIDNSYDMDEPPPGLAIAEQLADSLMLLAYPQAEGRLTNEDAEMIAVEMADKAQRRGVS